MDARISDLVRELELELKTLKDRLENSRPNFLDASVLSKKILDRERLIAEYKKRFKNN